MQQELLPLFPLQVVLLPGATIALHIFEERYKEMIGEAIRNRSEFGVVLASDKGIVNTGCTAVVDRVVREYPDGRLDIIARGRRRFEILLLNEERSFLRGAVEFFEDEPGDAAPADLLDQLVETYRELKSEDSDDDEAKAAPAPFSFQLAELIPDLNFRQMLLATRSEAERLRRLIEYLPGFIQKLRRVRHIRTVAPTNGHARPMARLE
ncbi:MAG TPA: LON peptidase substrate-binding domain-containing protein [Bryobacteraceae bacterium]|nr:LON peptidase substrate-binding domain-containing protein [Bryobacteraceae bacterium]